MIYIENVCWRPPVLTCRASGGGWGHEDDTADLQLGGGAQSRERLMGQLGRASPSLAAPFSLLPGHQQGITFALPDPSTVLSWFWVTQPTMEFDERHSKSLLLYTVEVRYCSSVTNFRVGKVKLSLWCMWTCCLETSGLVKGRNLETLGNGATEKMELVETRFRKFQLRTGSHWQLYSRHMFPLAGYLSTVCSCLETLQRPTLRVAN